MAADSFFQLPHQRTSGACTKIMFVRMFKLKILYYSNSLAFPD